MIEAGKNVVVQSLTLEPGWTSGWHHHPGDAYVIMRKGKLTQYINCNEKIVWDSRQGLLPRRRRAQRPIPTTRARNWPRTRATRWSTSWSSSPNVPQGADAGLRAPRLPPAAEGVPHARLTAAQRHQLSGERDGAGYRSRPHSLSSDRCWRSRRARAGGVGPAGGGQHEGQRVAGEATNPPDACRCRRRLTENSGSPSRARTAGPHPSRVRTSAMWETLAVMPSPRSDGRPTAERMSSPWSQASCHSASTPSPEREVEAARRRHAPGGVVERAEQVGGGLDGGAAARRRSRPAPGPGARPPGGRSPRGCRGPRAGRRRRRPCRRRRGRRRRPPSTRCSGSAWPSSAGRQRLDEAP